MSDKMFSEYSLGGITLRNRVVMAPMTRCRAIGNIPNDLMATYYQQRSTAGLIITEGTSPSPNGLGYARIPGIYSKSQIEGWKKITHAVHERGGKIFIQLMHTGRVSHPDNMQKGTKILAPSAIALAGEMWTDAGGMQAFPVPLEMTENEIWDTINEYACAAENAIEAGFDGIELHGANGYLIDQFLNTASNKREDQWGGSIENRIRFALEVATSAIKKIGADRVAMRISPYGVASGMQPDSQMTALYQLLASKLQKLNLVYLHIADHSSMGAPKIDPAVKPMLRQTFTNTLILSGGYDGLRARQDIDEGRGDLIAFGKPFISNPDLVDRLKTNKPLVKPDPSLFYASNEKGYTDFPEFEAAAT